MSAKLASFRAPARAQARRRAAFGLAALATLGVAVSFASRIAGADSSAGPRTEGVNAPMQGSRSSRMRLAYTGENWPRSFFEGLFGMQPRTEPRPPRRRPMVERRAPRPEPQRESRGRRTTMHASPRGPNSRGAERARRGRADDGATYRTMCVRLCDGYYWPISFATGKASFERDSRTCTQSCDSPAALYYHPNPGGEPEEMISLRGTPYKDLGTALLYRATYDASCKCRPHPWEAESIARHRQYAQQKQQQKQSRAATRR